MNPQQRARRENQNVKTRFRQHFLSVSTASKCEGHEYSVCGKIYICKATYLLFCIFMESFVIGTFHTGPF